MSAVCIHFRRQYVRDDPSASVSFYLQPTRAGVSWRWRGKGHTIMFYFTHSVFTRRRFITF